MARRIPSRKKKKTFTSVRKVAFEERVEPDDLLPKEVISDDLELEAESADLDRDEDTTPIPVAESQALDAAEVQAALPAEDKNCSSEETEVETFQGEVQDEIPADDLEIDHEKSEIETEVPPLPNNDGKSEVDEVAEDEISSEDLEEDSSGEIETESKDAEAESKSADEETVEDADDTSEEVVPAVEVAPILDDKTGDTDPEVETAASPFDLVFEETAEETEGGDDSPELEEIDKINEPEVETEKPEPEPVDFNDDEEVIVETKHEIPFDTAPRAIVAPMADAAKDGDDPVKEEPAEASPPPAVPVPEPKPEILPRILVVNSAGSTRRLVRETLENFGVADVDTCPDAVYGFELALKQEYQLYIFALHLPLIEGPLLYELISKSMRFAGGIEDATKQAPGIVYIRETGDPVPSDDLNRDARVKGFLKKPLKIERMLQVVRSALPKKGKAKKSFFA